MSEDFEELEKIPWAALAATPGDTRARYLTVAVAIVAVAGFVGWLLLRDQGPEIPSVATTLAPATTVVAEPPPDTSAIPSASVYTEADLMLIDVADEERLAVMHAEWLVRDYLTVDGDVERSERINALLPGNGDAEPLPTYVEWVEAFAVTTPEPGRYLVEVVYRILIDEGEGFVRQPAAGMAVDLAVDVDGTARLLAAPEPVPVPELRSSEE